MFARLVRLSRQRSRGAATLEYAAAFALVAILVGGTSVSARASTPAYGNIVQQAICKVATAVGMEGGCSGGTGPTDPNTPPTDPGFDPKPKKCKVSEHGEEVNSEIKIAFIKFGENAGFIERTFSDGTVTYTATDGASLGVTGGFGGKLDLGKVERGAQVDFGAGVKFDYGSTWTFKNAEEAAAMRKQLDDYLVEQEIIKHDPYYSIKFLWSDPKEPPKPPSQSVSTIETTFDAEGKLGLSLPFDTDPNSESGVPNLNLADFGLKFGTTGKWTQIKDNETGNTTYTTGGEVFGEANANVGPMGGQLKGILGSSIAITRDKDNNIVGVTMVTTREGKATSSVNVGQGDLGGKGSDSDSASAVTVTTANLPVTTAGAAGPGQPVAGRAGGRPQRLRVAGDLLPRPARPGRPVPEPDVHQRHGEQRRVQQRQRQDRLRGRGQAGRRLRHRPEPGDHRLAGGRRDLPRRARAATAPGRRSTSPSAKPDR